ncbi:MAG: hypothetical protein PHF44_02490 [Candidatus Pacebacteria bacterium]|nr:hypothetical protein [Candidatus Paceibacterota bacterium]
MKLGCYRIGKTNKKEKSQLKDGIAKFRQAIINDEEKERNKISNLPKDWASRLIRS